MNVADANIRAVITAKDDASRVLKGSGSNIEKFAKVATIALLAVGAAAVAVGVKSIKAFSEAEDAIAQTNAVLKSTKGIAGVTADEVTRLSKALQRTTTFSDEQVRSAENLLLTFTAIGKDIFPQATKSVLNMATALGEDTKSASIQLGKALQDPILGITALRRVGVNFNDAQKEVIKHLVETGHKAEAQKLILKELQTEFGGSAEAARTTFGGSLKALGNSLNDVEELIGGLIVKAIVPLITKVSEFVLRFNWEQAFRQVIETIKELYTQITTYLTPGIERFFEVATQVWNLLYTKLSPAFKALGDTLITQVWPQIKRVWETIEPAFTMALKVLAVVVGVTVVAALYVFVNVLNIAWRVIGFGIQLVTNLINWLGNLAGVVINVFRGIPNAIGKVSGAIYNAIIRPYQSAYDFIKSIIEKIKGAFNTVTSAPGKVFSGIGGLLGKIPGFAEGGIVPGPIGTPQLAVVHGGETITPTGKTGNGSVVNININAGAFMGSDIEARKFAKTILIHMKDLAGTKNMTVSELLGD